MGYSKRECGAEELGRRALNLVERLGLTSQDVIRITRDTGPFVARK